MIQTHAAPVGAPSRGPIRRRRTYLLAGVVVLLVLCVLSLAIGTRNIPPGEVLATLFGHGSEDAIIWGTRFPRTLMGIVVGVALGLAGAVMQALTRNPLGDPGLLGISAGAAFGIVVAVATTGIASL
jgi:iron complex transport system permease protein